ncbi:cysteine dioxygenase [Marinihelvus fidelis]|uniref:Cysteine dioxygenase n=1 Tax=Marinihelvus fidelis TaxID=2613842 RepID=A0A5N0T724_9GAMM|nr:cysteine dioxygenase family protein [Marinihelvus fidelis]KAA9130558.1 cysteine dioxygenase [Marinihelvus fidelis]
MSLEFQGKDRMIERVDRAIYGECAYETTTCLRRALVECIADPGIRLPDSLFEIIPGHYARREVFTHPTRGYSMIAMTWGPGQGTPIHDHDGMWCVEGVWAGCIEVVSYQLLEQADDRYRFEEMGSIVAGCGSAGSLIPPHEYHTIQNTDPEKPAVSIHIYKHAMETCNMFMRDGDSDWYRKVPKTLELDAA